MIKIVKGLSFRSKHLFSKREGERERGRERETERERERERQKENLLQNNY